MEGLPEDLAVVFRAAVDYVRGDRDTAKLPTETRLEFYGLYKTATAGPCDTAPPSIFDQFGRKKHAAWAAQSGLSRQEAAERYVSLTEEHCPNFVEPEKSAPPPAPPLMSKESSVADLQSEVERLRRELARAEGGEPAEAAGYLYQYQSNYTFARGKWVLRFFELDGSCLKVYKSSKHRGKGAALNSWQLRHCVVKYEGPKKDGKFHAFCVRLADEEHVISHEGGLIVRASATTAEDAALWLQALQDAIHEADSKPEEEDAGPGTLGLASLEIPDTGEATEHVKPEAEPRLRRQLSEIADLPQTPLARRASESLTKATVPTKRAFDPSSYPPSRPMHKEAKPSLMSAEAGEQNYRGFINLAGLLLVVVNFRMIVDNIKKYGLLIQLPNLTDDRFEDWPCLTGVGLLHAHVFLAVWSERLASKGYLPETLTWLLQMVNVNSVIVIPCVIIYSPLVSSPPAASVYLLLATILWMKLVSYCHVNQDWRRSTRAGDATTLEMREKLSRKVKDTENRVAYPNNLTVGDIFYFWWAPTLSYQLNYPRSDRIRKSYVATLVLRMVVVTCLIIFISEQYVLPGMVQSVPDFESGDVFQIAERTLKLCVPTTYVWLLGFYLFFHLHFNLLAELLRFGDRVFYKDWWNATTIETYWRLWNLPVHHWLVRHCYFPCLRLGMSKDLAIFFVFFVSAFFHEFLVSVPFKNIRAWAFLAMMGQIPLVALSKTIAKFLGENNKAVGNIMFWVSFCILGQPLAVLLYYYDFTKQVSGGMADVEDISVEAVSGLEDVVNATVAAVLGGDAEGVLDDGLLGVSGEEL
mmetsp:Transcript_45251/g.141842  ORF Transcript_45251/g.141842 Transcript_45251/m.141842 type:complete len:809 (-) Transcript_45251:73-2499(-)